MRARTSSGSRCSDAAVKPTRSQKRTETIFRSSRAGGGCSASGAVQKPQNTKPSGFSFPQCEQVSTRSSVGPGPPGDKRRSGVRVLVPPDPPHRPAAEPEDEQEGDGVEAARTTPEVDGERGDGEDRGAVERDVGATRPDRDVLAPFAPDEIDEERNREEEGDPSQQEEPHERRLQRERDDDRRALAAVDQEAPQRRVVGEIAPHAVM